VKERNRESGIGREGDRNEGEGEGEREGEGGGEREGDAEMNRWIDSVCYIHAHLCIHTCACT